MPKPKNPLDKAYKLLQRRQHSQKEIRDKLRRAGFSEQKIGSTIKQLRSENLIDDKEFANVFISQKLARGSFGRRWLYIKLVQRGIKKEYIESALKKNLSENKEARLARDLFAQRLTSLGPATNKNLQKTARFLISRGFPQAIIYELIEKNRDS